jgi:photosystem II stability/assembly factor-like uncharacterized protein
MFFLLQPFFAQLQWHTQFTRKPLTHITSIANNKLSIFGGVQYSGSYIIYNSTDNGESWSFPIYQNQPVGGNHGASFATMCFVDSMYGWACQSSTNFLKTTDGGNQWYSIPINLSFYYVNGIFFINRNIGWITGQHVNYNNQIAKTTNGGTNWIMQSNNLPFMPGQLLMLNINKGYLIPSKYDFAWDSIASTSNGGNNWEYFKAGDTAGQFAQKIFFLDSLSGWILGYSGYICRTTNGGNNWSYCKNSISGTEDIFFINNLTGWIASSRRIWKTTNGGINWVNTYTNQDNNEYLSCVYFKNLNTGWVVNSFGNIIKSTNGGINWFNIIEPPYGVITDIYFSDNNNGWAIGNSYVSKTINGGIGWQNILNFNNIILNSVQFLNSNTGFITGSNGKILKTINGGQNWDSSTIGNVTYNSISFSNNSTGWVCGNNGSILKTSNTGINWVNQVSGTNFNLNSVTFLNTSTGFAVSDSGRILKTTNGGSNWIVNQPLVNWSYKDVYFLNTATGWAIGNKINGSWQNFYLEKIIIKTTDAGISWNNIYYQSTMMQTGGYMSIYFTDFQTGWIASTNDGILKTINGGINWFTDYPANDNYYSIFFYNNETGWVTGGTSSTGCGGTVVTTGNSLIGIKNNNSNEPQFFSLSQNYPNPFNPSTTIKFDIPKSSRVQIAVYDILGREVQQLLNEEKKPGSYEITWDASDFASGVYFYKLMIRQAGSSTDEFNETKKMVLMK